MAQLKEVIEKEIGIPQASQLIIEEKGIEYSTMHADDILPPPENKKVPSVRNILLLKIINRLTMYSTTV